MMRTNFPEIRMHIHYVLAHDVRVKDVSILYHCQNLFTFTKNQPILASHLALLRHRSLYGGKNNNFNF